jgi:AcrR family transcriptional regulator
MFDDDATKLEPVEEVHLNPLQRQNMRIFIEATKSLLKGYGAEGLSIRKIAGKAGYNSATLYNYFQDAEELILFGSVSLFRDMLQEITKALQPDMTERERYVTYFRSFNRFSFQNARIFYNLFYGAHSHELGHILRVYFQQLYPHELDGLTPHLAKSLREGTIVQGDRVRFAKIFGEASLSPSIKMTTPVLLNALYHTYLHEAVMQGKELDVEAHVAKFEKMLEFMLDSAAILSKYKKQ